MKLDFYSLRSYSQAHPSWISLCRMMQEVHAGPPPLVALSCTQGSFSAWWSSPGFTPLWPSFNLCPYHGMFAMPLWRDCASFSMCCMDVDPTSQWDSETFIIFPTLPLYTSLDSNLALALHSWCLTFCRAVKPMEDSFEKIEFRNH